MTNPTLRPVERKDDLPILQALLAAKRAAAGSKSWLKDYDIPDGANILEAIIDGREVQSVIVDEAYLFCYRVGQPWFGTPGKNLEECLVLRIYQNKSSFGRLIEAMEQIARECGCIGIHVQTDLASGDAVQRKYQQSGFRVEGVKLFKGVPHG